MRQAWALLAATGILAACSKELVLLRPKADAGAHGPDAGSPEAGLEDAGSPEAGLEDASPPEDARTAADSSERDAQVDAAAWPPALAAFDHTCAALAGELWCWGTNQALQLGLGDTMARLSPMRVSDFTDVVDVCASDQHSCALRSDGSLWCWGENVHGELGVGDLDSRSKPAQVGKQHFVRVACGGYDTCALKADGSLFCWGDNFEGKLGQGDAFGSPDRAVPTAVSPGTAFYDVSVGQGHVCAVTRAGELYCWGRNSQGQLGDQTSAEQARSPVRVDPQRLYKQVAAGQQHSCAVTRHGELFCWGTDSFGDLGLGATSGDLIKTPTQVGTDVDYVRVRASWFHTCALRTNGALACWGRNVEGQLGVGDNVDRSTPTKVGTSAEHLELAVGHFHTCAVRTGNAVYCWGINDENGQLGLGGGDRKNVPSKLTFPAAP